MLQHAAVVAAASEATRGLANERFESFERPPVNSPTYVAGQPPCLWESMQPQELELNRAASITRASSGASGSRIELQLATTAALLTIVRRKHGMPQRPVMQYLQGVALRRTCRIDGVRVTVHCAQRRPSAAHRNAPLRGGGGEVETRAAALRRPGPRHGVSTCRCASGSERRRSRTRRGAGVVEALEPSTGVSGARQPCGPAGRPTAKDGGETGTAVCVSRPGTPVDAAVDLDAIWRPGGLP